MESHHLRGDALTIEVRPDTVQNRDQQLAAAITMLQLAAASDRKQGIMVTRDGQDNYTAELHDAVPYGLRRQRVVDNFAQS